MNDVMQVPDDWPHHVAAYDAVKQCPRGLLAVMFKPTQADDTITDANQNTVEPPPIMLYAAWYECGHGHAWRVWRLQKDHPRSMTCAACRAEESST